MKFGALVIGYWRSKHVDLGSFFRFRRGCGETVLGIGRLFFCWTQDDAEEIDQ